VVILGLLEQQVLQAQQVLLEPLQRLQQELPQLVLLGLMRQ
jgi:hypothetical protein